MAVYLHEGDLPDAHPLLSPGPGGVLAIDTETMGLNPARDRLCLVQMSLGDGDCHLVRFAKGVYDAPNLCGLLRDRSVIKLFHFARFDLTALQAYLGVMPDPVYCTKVASKLVRTFTDRHGLKDLTKDLIGVEMNKQQQSSDWGAAELTQEQLAYAASDVLHLHAIKAKLDMMLAREGRTALAEACFAFLPTRAALDLAGWPEQDIFAH